MRHTTFVGPEEFIEVLGYPEDNDPKFQNLYTQYKTVCEQLTDIEDGDRELDGAAIKKAALARQRHDLTEEIRMYIARSRGWYETD